ncbi:hypothetical protein BMW23_0240 [Bodo saltans virus]|uniref:Uncharacterized protein n=1 Tax=Bodo saltans virus TaxID=2024608 RepID=A0A2H4UTT2_9VIRU|nr:hypothetical protein QJ851_gp0235 [Bodo saltans virus]ATZ80298.1 hypothetical protein BMW23_0240 [Bodo saltans virus]
MNNIYTNKHNKYNLNDNEIENIDNVWNLINDFSITELSRSKYRNKIIKLVNKKYTIAQLYTLEIIIEKMYWNLRDKILIFFDKPHFSISHNSLNRIEKKIFTKNNHITETNIRKSYVYDNKNKQFIIDYHYPNDIDIIVSSIIINRSIYETFMQQNIDFETFKIPPYSNIIEFDYPFPNLNTISPFVYNDETRKNNIILMYYSDNCENNWF